MRISPIVLLLFAMLGCGSGTEPAKPPESYDAAAVKKHMTPDQLALGDPVVNSVGMVLMPIPAGEFQMGSPDSDSDGTQLEKPQHLVKITKPFYLSVYEVTQQQYEKVMEDRPWHGQSYVKSGSDYDPGSWVSRQSNVKNGPDYPASWVSHDEAVEFCRKLSEQEGVEYRLPTEAQWEYACRAGTTTVYSYGDDESGWTGKSELGQHAWYGKNAAHIGENYPHRVGQKLPNPWGLYDMHGNVWEWCQDWYALYGSKKALSDPGGPVQSEYRVMRGGSFHCNGLYSRSADRPRIYSGDRFLDFGFRAARTYESKD